MTGEWGYVKWGITDNNMVSVSSDGVASLKQPGIYIIEADIVFYGLAQNELVRMSWNDDTTVKQFIFFGAGDITYESFRMTRILSISEARNIAIAVYHDDTSKTLHQSTMDIVKIQ